MAKPIFLLGLGNTKSGTTWLHHHLVNHPETAFHLNLTKEYDLVEVGCTRTSPFAWNPPKWLQYFKHRRWELSRKLGEKSTSSGEWGLIMGMPRRQFLSEYAQSGTLYAIFLKQSRRFRVVGDISPNTILQAPEKINAFIQSLRKDFDVRAVMMWRDPLSRMESMYKHSERASFIMGKQAFERAFIHGDSTVMSHFSQLTALKRLLKLDIETHHLLFEELFSPQGQTALDSFHDFLSLSHKPGSFDVAVNAATRNDKGFTPEQRQIMHEALRDEYTGLSEFFGETRLRAIWDFPSAS